MSATVPLTDEELATKALQGDREAFATLYARYMPQVYDLALRVTRSPDAAADVAQDTFLKVLDQPAGRVEFTSFRAWLYTIARHRAIDELRKTKRIEPLEPDDQDETAFSEPASAEPGPDRVAMSKEVAALVWQAAATLRPDEYALLDMHLRKGLEVHELAQVLGTNKGNVYTQLSRLQNALEGAITALIVSRRGNKACRELAALLTPQTAEMSPQMRRRILRHVQECEACQKVRRQYMTAAELLAGIAPVVPPASLQRDLLARLSARLPSVESAGGGASSSGGTGAGPSQPTFQTVALRSDAAGVASATVQAKQALPVPAVVLQLAIAIPIALAIVAVAALVLMSDGLAPAPVLPLGVSDPLTTPTHGIPPTPTADAAESLAATASPFVQSTETPLATPLPFTATPGVNVNPGPIVTLPIATATSPAPQALFWADALAVAAGQCTALHWRTQYIQAAYIDGMAVATNGDRWVCPSTTTSYTLLLQHAGGSMTRATTIQVNAATPTRSQTPPRTPTRTPTAVDRAGPTIASVHELADTMWYGASDCKGYYYTDIGALVTDSSGVGGVVLYYRRQGASTWSSRNMTLDAANDYTARVQSKEVAAAGTASQTMEYYIRARDTRGNSTSSTTGTVTIQYCR